MDLKKEEIEIDGRRFVTQQFPAYRGYTLLDKFIKEGADSALPSPSLMLEILGGTQAEVTSTKGKVEWILLASQGAFDRVFSGSGGLKRASQVYTHACKVNFADFQSGPVEESDEAPNQTTAE